MLNVKDIPQYILNDLIEAEFTREEIQTWDAKKAFEEYCQWNGLIHWGGQLWDVVHSLEDAEPKASVADMLLGAIGVKPE